MSPVRWSGRSLSFSVRISDSLDRHRTRGDHVSSGGRKCARVWGVPLRPPSIHWWSGWCFGVDYGTRTTRAGWEVRVDPGSKVSGERWEKPTEQGWGMAKTREGNNPREERETLPDMSWTNRNTGRGGVPKCETLTMNLQTIYFYTTIWYFTQTEPLSLHTGQKDKRPVLDRKIFDCEWFHLCWLMET